jgi:hypothetical protein
MRQQRSLVASLFLGFLARLSAKRTDSSGLIIFPSECPSRFFFFLMLNARIASFKKPVRCSESKRKNEVLSLTPHRSRPMHPPLRDLLHHPLVSSLA